MYLVKENEVYKREREVEFTLVETVTFKLPEERIYNQDERDWYMTVALEKVDKVTKNRHQLTAELIIRYRNAIRNGFQKGFDQTLNKPYDYPRNQNTVKGIQGYIDRMDKAMEDRLKSFEEN